MSIKVKELKEDIIVDVKINKSFYMMLKSTLFFIFQLEKDPIKKEESLKMIKEGVYEKMNDFEKSFFTITLILAEIEKQAKEGNLFEEKEILEPGDEGYIEPKLD